jgi:TRAP-type C4-dicarboxylate transport system permease small subunit
MQTLLRAVTVLSRWLNYLSAVAISIIACLVTLSVVARYLLDAPFRFTEELVGLLMSAALFLALPLAHIERRDVAVTLITDSMPRAVFRVIGILAQAIVFFFCCAIAWDAWHRAAFALRLNLKSEAASLPLAPWMIVMPVSFALLAVVAVLVRPRRDKDGA